MHTKYGDFFLSQKQGQQESLSTGHLKYPLQVSKNPKDETFP